MTIQELKIQNYAKFLTWIKESLSTEEVRTVKRTEVAALLEVSDTVMSRGLLVLTNHDILKKRSAELAPSGYIIIGDINAVTPEILDKWITEYNAESSARSDAKKRTGLATTSAPAESLFSKVTQSTEGAFDQFKQLKPFVQSAATSIEFVPTVALTPAQQRLKEAKEMLEQAEQAIEEEAKQQAETPSMPGTSEELFTLLDNRVESIEGKVNVMLSIFEQATATLRGLSSVGDHETAEEGTTAEPTIRTQLVRLVNSYAAAERRSEHETWKYLYGQFDLRTGYNVYARVGHGFKGQSYLTVIEKHSQIEALHDLAKKLLVLPALR